MNLITLDFETFFSDDYTLKKMTTEAYIRDPRFEALGCAIRTSEPLPELDMKAGESRYFEQPQLHQMFASVDWAEQRVLAHHAHFDGLILNHHYDVRPAFWFDTLSMARLVHGNHLSVSLESLARHYNLRAKSVPYDLFRGRRFDDLDDSLQAAIGRGCGHDCELTWQIFEELIRGFPREELVTIDTTIRMFTEPTLVGDEALFMKIRDEEAASKARLLDELNVSAGDLQSAAKFVALLEAEGVGVPVKAGRPARDGTPRWNPCIAATDPFMKELLNDEDDRVATLAAARLEVRSTIAETRAGRLAGMAARGPLPIYLGYCGAHTTRWSGGDRVNFQNLTRSLRPGVRAPAGHKFIRVDQSQGECRIVNWLAGQWDVVERFAKGDDVYLPMAEAFYHRPITKEDKEERTLGKTIELACGFAMGGPQLKATARARAGIILTDKEALNGRDAYRDTHLEVVKLWRYADRVLLLLSQRSPNGAAQRTSSWGPTEVREGKIYLPNGTWLDYTSLKYEDSQWWLKTRNGWTKYYGAKLVQNVVQALSRVITSQAMIKVRNAGLRVVGTTHDDFWVLAKDHEAERAAEFCRACIAMSPTWAHDLPLGAEAHSGESYA